MDHILYWNAVALEANRRDFTDIPLGSTRPLPEQGGPTLSSRALAIVHLAMYDAHAAVVASTNLPRYLTGPPPTAGLSAAAAVAGAAFSTLSALYPRQKLHFEFAAGGVVPGSDASFDFGISVGALMLGDRLADPSAGDAGYVPSNLPFHHRPDPITAQTGFHGPFYGTSKCFAVQARHDLDNPRGNTAQYVRAVKHVHGKGIAPELMGTLPSTYSKRTAEQTLIGEFWAYDGVRGVGTPPRFYNQIIRQIAMEQNNTVDKNASLFAFVNAAMGDAGILAWAEKYRWDLWRPVLGIREYDPTMGPAPTPGPGPLAPECDPEWRPLGAPNSNSIGGDFTPPFPAYPSGHATFGAAAFHITRLFYGVAPGDRKRDTLVNGPVVSEELNGSTRDSRGAIRPRHTRPFPDGLWQMIEENGFSRVYLGVHWFLDAFAFKTNKEEPDYTKKRIGGVNLGIAIAEDMWTFGNQKGPKKSTV